MVKSDWVTLMQYIVCFYTMVLTKHVTRTTILGLGTANK